MLKTILWILVILAAWYGAGRWECPLPKAFLGWARIKYRIRSSPCARLCFHCSEPIQEQEGTVRTMKYLVGDLEKSLGVHLQVEIAIRMKSLIPVEESCYIRCLQRAFPEYSWRTYRVEVDP